MTEADEVADSIYQMHMELWPITRDKAVELVKLYLAHESYQVRDNVIDALLELNNK